MMREYGINPVFPPREDLQVGDVYLRRGDPADARFVRNAFVPIDLWVASLQPSSVERHYERRGSFPDSLEDSLTDEEGKVLPGRFVKVPADAGDPANAFSRHDLSRLRQVAFPDFLSLSVQSGDVRALVPVQALSIGFGASWQNDQQADVKIPAAESYGIPFSQIKASLFDPGSTPARISPQIATHADLEMFRRRLDALAPTADPCPRQYVYLDVITEVYYARVMDIAISTKYAVGTRVRVEPMSKSVVTETTSTETRTGEDAPSTQTTTTKTTERATVPLTGDPIARAQALNERLREVDDLNKVGGTFQFISVSENSVGMRRSYQRPVAIGWRGVTLRVRVRDGAVDGVGSADSPYQTTFGSLDLHLAVQGALDPSVKAILSGASEYSIVVASLPSTDTAGLVIEVRVEAAIGAELRDKLVVLGSSPEVLRRMEAALARLPQADKPDTDEVAAKFKATMAAIRGMRVRVEVREEP